MYRKAFPSCGELAYRNSCNSASQQKTHRERETLWKNVEQLCPHLPCNEVDEHGSLSTTQHEQAMRGVSSCPTFEENVERKPKQHWKQTRWPRPLVPLRYLVVFFHERGRRRAWGICVVSPTGRPTVTGVVRWQEVLTLACCIYCC